MLRAKKKCQKNVKEVSIRVKSREIVFFLRLIMNHSTKYLIRNFALVVFFIFIASCTNDENKEISEVVKVSLREVGHKILLFNQDSTSLVQPVIALKKQTYQLSFEVPVSIHPDSLVNAIRSSFQKANLPEHYLTEVKKCEDGEVAYSYQMKQDVDKDIVPCGGRQLHKACYVITVRFTKILAARSINVKYFYLIIFSALLLFVFVFYKKKAKHNHKINDGTYAKIGSFQFYPDQNKLVKQATEINLSKKECELLEILAASPNQVVKRDELEKRVWEDNGVVVGRSLDTYISKLRKILKDDTSIKLTNVHGVGYKLEIQ